MQPSLSNQKVMLKMMICFWELETNYWIHKSLFGSSFSVIHAFIPIDNFMSFQKCKYMLWWDRKQVLIIPWFELYEPLLKVQNYGKSK